jgi:hypothetical protein
MITRGRSSPKAHKFLVHVVVAFLLHIDGSWGLLISTLMELWKMLSKMALVEMGVAQVIYSLV